MKWQYIYELPLGIYYGQNCLNFPERTVCFGNEMPAPLDLIYMNVSQNQMFQLATECQLNAKWYLPRIQQPSDTAYSNYNPYPKNSSEVSFVVLDTWMDVDHEEFEGRASRWRSFQPHNPKFFPRHGTHCGGLIGSKSYGTARQSKIYSVQVLKDDGQGDYATLIQSLDYVYKQVCPDKSRKYIVSMSIGGPKSDAFNHAVEAVANCVPVFVAAGNDAQDACNSSPSSVASAMTVASSNILNKFSLFSNSGSCVNIIAPGENILSLCPQNLTCYMSGTSMATPLSAGLAAHFWLKNPNLSPNQLFSKMIKESAWNVIQNVPQKTPNRFLSLKQDKCPQRKSLLFQ